LPWSMIDAGVSTRFLQLEAERAYRGQLSPDCRRSCHACGILQTYGEERTAIAPGTWGCP